MRIRTVLHISVIFITVFVLVTSQVASAQTSEVEQATADARRDAELNVSPIAWGSAGFVCSFFAPIYAYVALPEVPVGALLGKSPEYVDAYTLVYQENVRRRRIQASIIGCAIGSALGTITSYMVVSQNGN
ncbi:hypothetical protein F4X10_06400 [Candidatus Poribacteria bacterium]|nr:hypothetical protein [Candidatus Poribacteria bacterium]